MITKTNITLHANNTQKRNKISKNTQKNQFIL